MDASGRRGWSEILGERDLIFVTVGTQLAFDRLVDGVDGWVANHPDVKAFAQIGPALGRPRYLESAELLSPDLIASYFERAKVIVAHAGMGSILTALQFKKPIIVMPRRADLGEHRNDHQMATAKWLGGRCGIYVAQGVEELQTLLGRRDRLGAGTGISPTADPTFIERLRIEIFGQ